MNLLKAILPKRLYLKNNIHNDSVWEPLNYGKDKKEAISDINIGDYIAIEILTETTDHIYQIVYRKNGRMKPNRRKLWKVIKKFDNDIMIQCGSEKIVLKYSNWTGDNIITTPKKLMMDEASYAFFKVIK